MRPTPKGWPRISAGVFYQDAGKAIAWLCEAFGFEVRLEVEGEGGRVEHSELTYAGGLVMIGEPRDKAFLVAPPDVAGANTQNLFVYVDDVEAHCARARAAGAEILREPADSDYGEDHWADRGYECRDPGGQRWWFAQRLREAASFAPRLDAADAAAQHPPKGWPRMASALYYPEPARAIDWLCAALGFEIQIKVEGEAGEIVHSELVFGGGLVMVSDEAKDLVRWPHRKSPRTLGGRTTQYCLIFVDDVKAACERARGAGATITDEPKISDYGEDYWADLACGVTDPGGHHWWLVQRLGG
jgi:uncharacterized glyoxalase superfamily protein PhnB